MPIILLINWWIVSLMKCQKTEHHNRQKARLRPGPQQLHNPKTRRELLKPFPGLLLQWCSRLRRYPFIWRSLYWIIVLLVKMSEDTTKMFVTSFKNSEWRLASLDQYGGSLGPLEVKEKALICKWKWNLFNYYKVFFPRGSKLCDYYQLFFFIMLILE